MFRIKICGITTENDARTVARAGADAVGLNFFAKSPRYITPERGSKVAAALPGSVVKVGLFVNADAKDVVSIFDSIPLDLIQLHGNEPPEFLATLGGRPVVRAFRLGPEAAAPIIDYLQQTDRLGCRPEMALVDTHVPGEYGGTGVVADWQAAARLVESEEIPPLILAGGLTPQNITAAVQAVRPHGVDTASGVELSPGKKDPAAVEAFVRAAQQALALK